MGYYTYFTGEAKVSPPLPETEWKNLSDGGYFKFTQVEGDEDVQIINGVITVVGKTPGHTEIALAFDESIKGYDFAEWVEKIAKKCIELNLVMDGCFEGDGEESNDMWRLDITNNQLTQEAAQVIYPSDLNRDLYEKAKHIDELRKAVQHGHGHILPRADLVKTRCGGTPASCPTCAAEAILLKRALA